MNIEQGMSKEEGGNRHEKAQGGQGPQPKRATARTLLVRFPLVAQFLPEKQTFAHMYYKKTREVWFDGFRSRELAVSKPLEFSRFLWLSDLRQLVPFFLRHSLFDILRFQQQLAASFG
jgi:hypothetical protein